MSVRNDLLVPIAAGIGIPLIVMGGGISYIIYDHGYKGIRIEPSQIFSLSPPSGATFPVNVRLIDNSVVSVSGCFSEMKVSELMRRTAVALQTPPGRVQLQIDGYPIRRDLTIGQAGIAPTTLLDFRTCLQGVHPMEDELLRSYTQLLNGDAITVTKSQLWAWHGALVGTPLTVTNDYSSQLPELFAKWAE
jgi:hypothetical protein